MLEKHGDLFDYQGKEVDAIVIPTNGVVTKRGNVMGKGIALLAKQKHPDFPISIGQKINEYGNRVFAWHPPRWDDPWYLTFPTKYSYWEDSDLTLIKKSMIELVEIVDSLKLTKIWLPRVGCGNGNLLWKDIEPLCREHLNDRFTVIYA